MALLRSTNGIIGPRLTPKLSSALRTARRTFTTKSSSGVLSPRCFRRSMISVNAASSSAVHPLPVLGLDFGGVDALRL